MCKFCGHEKFLAEIEELLNDPDYEWAEDTLHGIAETVEGMEHCTPGQQAAIDNIVEAVQRRG
ncbi:MAG: hypothetical protein A2Z40_04050 [Deltaproteobacteria bacterium RBG_19FT_COMBO_60_16]|nr:MAG: hypothetical protein A2Z40_04050 [Deltaproteobacteria bacterium RBG_19FT_COMBO_60_16]